MTEVQPLLFNAVFKYHNIKDVTLRDLDRDFYTEAQNDLVRLIRFLLPVAAKQMGYQLSPYPTLPFWAGVVVWRYVLWYYNAPEIPVCLCELTANVKLKAIFNEARLNVNKINKIVLQTLNDIIDSITAGKIVCISNKLNPL